VDLKKSNNPPDVVLELTHEQATFMLENCLANKRLIMAMILSIAKEKSSIEEKREKSEKIARMNEEFSAIMELLRRAGAREKEDE
jgi:hypothetical protein